MFYSGDFSRKTGGLRVVNGSFTDAKWPVYGAETGGLRLFATSSHCQTALNVKRASGTLRTAVLTREARTRQMGEYSVEAPAGRGGK